MRDGLVGVKRMEKAFQRQVIYGGSLDTILLEMGLVPEDRLTQYLALASGLPPANRAETQVFDPEALRRCPEAIAHKLAGSCELLGLDASGRRLRAIEKTAAADDLLACRALWEPFDTDFEAELAAAREFAEGMRAG